MQGTEESMQGTERVLPQGQFKSAMPHTYPRNGGLINDGRTRMQESNTHTCMLRLTHTHTHTCTHTYTHTHTHAHTHTHTHTFPWVARIFPVTTS